VNSAEVSANKKRLIPGFSGCHSDFPSKINSFKTVDANRIRGEQRRFYACNLNRTERLTVKLHSAGFCVPPEFTGI
jgi:hypothetical protein